MTDIGDPPLLESLLDDWTVKRAIVGEFHRLLGFTPQQAENYVQGSLKNPMLQQIPTLRNYVENMLRP